MSKKLFSLIYSGQIHAESGTRVIPKDEYSILLDAKQVLNKAKEDTKLYLENTKKECEELKKQAKKEGFHEGLIQFNKHLVWLEQKMKAVEHETGQKVLSIALQAAKKIVGKQLSIQPNTIVEIVKNTIRPVVESKEVVIFVSAKDHAAVNKCKEDLKAMFGSIKTFAVEEREDLQPGGCIIQTETGIINASLENQWRAIEAAFEEFMKK